VVADSNGPYEYNEATNKARAVLNAIAAAETLAAPDFGLAVARPEEEAGN
jgi:anthranilate synthase component 1